MYVDDLLIIGVAIKNIERMKMMLSRKFEMKDLGIPKVLLGMARQSNTSINHIKLSMKNMIIKLEKGYQIKATQRKLSIPIEKSFNGNNENFPILNQTQHKEFWQIIVLLLFIANTVSLDIAYLVSLLSRYLVTPRKCHLNAAYRIIHYLIQTEKTGLYYTNETKPKLPTKDYRLLDMNEKAIMQDYLKKGKYLVTTATDASFANEENRHSQRGSITYLNNNIITWMSKRQNIVALSSAEAEYISMTEALKSNLRFNNLPRGLGFHTTYGKICSDNMAALQLSSHKIYHQRTKHIDLRYHFISEKIQSKKMKLDYVNTNYNTADCLTKLVDSSSSNRLQEFIFKNPKIQ